MCDFSFGSHHSVLVQLLASTSLSDSPRARLASVLERNGSWQESAALEKLGFF